MSALEITKYDYPEWVNCSFKRDNDPFTTKPSGVQYTENGKFLVVEPINKLEILPDCVWWRNYTIASQIRNLIPPEYTVLVPQKPISQQELDNQIEQHNLHWKKLYVYGSILPEHIWKRSTKIQVHNPLLGDKTPQWFDNEFPKHIRETTIPGYSTFSIEKLTEAVSKILADHPQARVKDPNAASGEDQVVISKMQDLTAFIQRRGSQLEKYLNTNGLAVEANLKDVIAYSVTVTTTPEGIYTSIGQQVESIVELPPEKGGGTMSEYGGTSAVTYRGMPKDIPPVVLKRPTLVHDPAAPTMVLPLFISDQLIQAAQKHIESMKLWEKDGIFRSRANVDVLSGTLEYNNGQTAQIVGSVEDSGRVGGASSEEIRSIAALSKNPSLPLAVHSSRHIFNPEDAKPYLDHISDEGGYVYWNGHDTTWGDKYIMICVF